MMDDLESPQEKKVDQLGTCPFCCQFVHDFQAYKLMEMETLHGDYEVVIGLAFAHEECIK